MEVFQVMLQMDGQGGFLSLGRLGFIYIFGDENQVGMKNKEERGGSPAGVKRLTSPSLGRLRSPRVVKFP